MTAETKMNTADLIATITQRRDKLKAMIPTFAKMVPAVKMAGDFIDELIEIIETQGADNGGS